MSRKIKSVICGWGPTGIPVDINVEYYPSFIHKVFFWPTYTRKRWINRYGFWREVIADSDSDQSIMNSDKKDIAAAVTYVINNR